MEIAICGSPLTTLKEYSHHLPLPLLASAKPISDNPELSREEPEAPPENTEYGQLI
jgi:hypothetical protein